MNAQVPAIEFRNVVLRYGDNVALNDVSFTLNHGEMILMTGVSGSGKSVLLRLAMGLLKPDSGQISIEGKEIQALDESELITLRGGLMGMVFQEDSLFTGLPVYDNAAYRLEEHGWCEDEIDRAVAEVLQFVGLEGEESKFPEELSGGMKRRLEIARALIGWPRIMLFDEPTMSLDPLAALKVLDLVIRARDVNKISSLYVTKKIHEIHYLATYRAETLSDGEIRIIEAPSTNLPKTRVIVLEGGRIAFDGSAAQFATSELKAIQELSTLDRHDHSHEPYFIDPWDKRRHPAEPILQSPTQQEQI
ncbi:MAG TPA: ATP-binding cassette domain-containing protein [Pyrinomonadaceae bacterium]|jgi:phospholipid/cholesterol/gamma-HCH transport system ATP-binding protein|nr:ATP-binding cassette domain-containing protein [Pyrinomonadaceae bacterium]